MDARILSKNNRFLNHPSLAWSSQPQSNRDHIYWSRGRQEGSGSLCPTNRKELAIRGMAQAHSLPIHVRESPWEVAGRTEHVMKNAVWEEELRMQDVSLESWKQPRELGRQASDTDGQKGSQERFEGLYQFVHGEHVPASQNKKKSQSLPGALSPKSLNFTEIPVPLHDGHTTGVPKVPPYPPSFPPPLEPTRNLEKASFSGPFPRPKFGKPLKTPCYGSHSQPRGEGGFQDHQHRDPRGSYPTRSKDPSHELGMLDTGLEPPMYVPPPSYRSPPQHIPNPYLEDPVPTHVSSHQSQQQLPEKPEGSCPLPSGSLAARDLYDAMPGSPPQGLPPQPYPVATHGGSIQYIPFDDPRIRHIKLAQPPEFYKEAKLDDTPYNSGLITKQEPAVGERQYGDVFSTPWGPTPPPVNQRGSALVHSSPRWLQGQQPMGIEPGGFHGQTEHHIMRRLATDVRDSKAESHASSPQPQSEGTCKTYTKLRKFETGVQSKKSSKKSNATIFCLVSVPVKSESLVPDTDTNNNDLKLEAAKTHGRCQGPALEEQRLLSMSSTDLELQALMGNMAWRRTSPRQGLGESEDGQTDDPRILHLIKPRELLASGLWPGHQYRDQQTQTSFPEDSKSSQLLPATKPGEASNAAPTPTGPDTTASEAHLQEALAFSDQNQKASVPHLRGQMSLSPSRNSAFSRTSSAISQASLPKGAPAQLPSANPVPKPEVVKGESTTGQCNSTQLFGQFLLKPVSRRPWDLISQLESFNKELQEEEESRGASGSEDGEAEQPEGCDDSRAKTWDHQESRIEWQPAGLALEDAASPHGRIHESQSWTEELKPGYPGAHPQSLGPSQEEGSRGGPVQWADRNLTAEQKSQEVLNGMCERDISPRPVSRIAPIDTKAAPLFCLAEPRGSQELTKVSDALGSVQLGRETPTKVDSGGDTEVLPCVLLPLADKYQGLSTPDFRSLELTLGQEQSAYKSECLGLENTMEVLPSESLQERAERILGIEVAMESLLPGARRTEQSQLPEPDASACGPRSSREDSSPSLAPPGSLTVATDAFYGRRKCGWTESPLFVGERAPQASVSSDVDGFPASQATSPEPGQKDEEAKPPFKSTLFHFMEKSTNVVDPEKSLRNPSKEMESLQDKLVSPPKRADSVRLMRMREVKSLSQMGCLSSKSADSMEEPDPLEVIKSPAQLPEGLTSLSGKDQAWQSGHLPPVPQDENGHPEVPREKMSDQDLWCADAYDPSRVERV
ncbi:junctional protein associated with coronary artery disease isoform X3 [Mastomys coucha]|uniref:junctional protein associated with coronary artery disease isoform X3 n=1 Tax=Mastomys coucha TaxID=35658 RepID=UPI001261D78C|nr:junctional protein associated with coronary artery disease isoform X3 [Mastomys coucha]XP_031220732.1 junctional protein associated with coronary artery disease isoform X3 [Mastomys coucha]